MMVPKNWGALRLLTFLSLLLHVGCAQPANGPGESSISGHLLLASNKGPFGSEVKNAVLSITSKDQLFNEVPPYTQSHPFSDYTLSPACGHHISRCRELTIIRDSSNSHVTTLTPLDNAIGVMRFKEIDGVLFHDITHIVEYQGQGFTPLTIVEFDKQYYTMGFNSLNHITSCWIKLNFNNFTKSHLQCSSLQLAFPMDFDYRLISNFVNIDSEEYLVFAIEDTLYKYFPGRNSISPLFFCPLPHSESNVTLTFNGHSTVLVYYSAGNDSIVVPFDIHQECWEFSYANQELEYHCFNGYNVFVYPSASAILLEKQDKEEGDTARQISIMGTNFTTGTCFGDFFVYVDRFEGTFILNTNSETYTKISSTNCMSGDCEQPLVYNDRYVLLRDRGGGILVIDTSQGYTTMISLSSASGTPALIGYFTGVEYTKEIAIVKPGNRKDSHAPLVPIIMGTIVMSCVLLLCLGITVLSVWVGVKSRPRGQPTHHTQADTEDARRSLIINGQNTPDTISQDGFDVPSQPPAPADSGTPINLSTNTVDPTHEEDAQDVASHPPQPPAPADSGTPINLSTNSVDPTHEEGVASYPPSTAPSTPSTTTHTPETTNEVWSRAETGEYFPNTASSASLSALYPGRGQLPVNTEPDTVVGTRARTLSSATQSSTSSLSFSAQELTRESYPVTGASNNDISYAQPVQVSGTSAVAPPLRYDCGSVLTTMPSGSSITPPTATAHLNLPDNS